MTDKARFKLELSLAYEAMHVEVEPGRIDAKTVIEAWHLLNGFLIDFIDEQGIEPTDEEFRELMIELCYHLVYREMCVLTRMPGWEEVFKDRLEEGKRIQKLPRRKKGQ